MSARCPISSLFGHPLPPCQSSFLQAIAVGPKRQRFQKHFCFLILIAHVWGESLRHVHPKYNKVTKYSTEVETLLTLRSYWIFNQLIMKTDTTVFTKFQRHCQVLHTHNHLFTSVYLFFFSWHICFYSAQCNKIYITFSFVDVLKMIIFEITEQRTYFN